MSGGGLPTTSHESVMLPPLSASIDLGRVLNTGPSIKIHSIDTIEFDVKTFVFRLMKIDVVAHANTYS